MNDIECRGLLVRTFRGTPVEREQCERSLMEGGVALPMSHRGAWARVCGDGGSWFVGVADPHGCWRGGFGIEIHRSRTLPGYQVWRVQRFGWMLPRDVRDAALEALTALARRSRRVLRVHVEAFSPDSAVLEDIVKTAAELGFKRVPRPRCYEETVTVDLAGDEAALFASLHRTARQNIRVLQKHPVVVRMVADGLLCDRLDALWRETLARTGGRLRSRNWRAIIDFSVRNPTLSRVVGLYRTDVTGPESLLAFAWGCNHGDHVQYCAAASTRRTDLRIPLGYAPAWDLIRWAKDQGASWFDFGGISAGRLGTDDPVGGISDFKRYFSRVVTRVGEEWAYEPHAWSARLGRVASAAAGWMSRFRPHRT